MRVSCCYLTVLIFCAALLAAGPVRAVGWDAAVAAAAAAEAQPLKKDFLVIMPTGDWSEHRRRVRPASWGPGGGKLGGAGGGKWGCRRYTLQLHACAWLQVGEGQLQLRRDSPLLWQNGGLQVRGVPGGGAHDRGKVAAAAPLRGEVSLRWQRLWRPPVQLCKSARRWEAAAVHYLEKLMQQLQLVGWH